MMALLITLLFFADAREAFHGGNRLYLDGRFEEALEAYSDGLEAGVEPALFLFNAGNCRFRLGRYGEAAHSYLSALHYRPRDGDARSNLELIRKRLGIEASLHPQRWRFITSLEWLCLGLLFACPAILLLACRRRWSALLLFAVSAVLVTVSLVPGPRHAVAVRAAQVLNEPAVRVGEPVFSLHEGVSVRITGEREGWLEIEDEKNRCGWARSGDVWPLP